VKELLREYMRWAMPIKGKPEETPEYKEMCKFLPDPDPDPDPDKGPNQDPDKNSVKLVSFSDYLGEEAKEHLHIKEVVNASDPELDKAVEVYDQVFKPGATAIASDDFRVAFKPGGLAYRRDYRYHLWTIRSNVGGPCEGMASFLTMPSAGFGGYLGLLDPLRKPEMLPGLIARIEERMVRDGTPDRLPDSALEGKGVRRRLRRVYTRVSDLMVRDSTPGNIRDSTRDREFDLERARALLRRLVAGVKPRVHEATPDSKRARGWYIECDDETRNVFEAVGFRKVDVEYLQPPLPRKDKPLIQPLHLMYKPFGRVYKPFGRVYEAPAIKRDEFLHAMREIYTSIYGIDEPDKDDIFKDLRESVLSRDVVEMKLKAGES
jgi:hypothetical protein